MSLFEDRAEARRWSGAFLLVLALHAVPALIAAFWLAPMISGPPASPPAVMIDMAPSAAPPIPPSERPPGPKQKVQTLKPKAVTDLVKTPPVANPTVALPPVPPQPPQLEQKQPAPETTAPPVKPLPPASTPSSAAPTWKGLVLGQLEKFKRYPALAQYRRQQGVPYIRFVMDRNGKVLSSRLERSSGFPVLDEEAAALPKRAQPLPKPPEEVTGDTIELIVPIEFFIGGAR